ncbi:aspartyl/glutamyl-tRNA amidotransferase subunit A [Candidatus Falkowbacteria bacterium RIFOXYA2_FULL_47_9]|uniref:Glutamyl-tRNA(Gln) amidotransferase subunit A n=1 Tax=Candidatus Falkowbacteria bacterium RIFOXYA2_FULL_47_9 TaxID=1797995 RepID=A0A1F5SRI1_9BACT|nr:MAG: aspartyl/glutamyl-tRNA amidotransferase subunit A [Candidatus Falkowbacteria bacterium RIFOXYA2_FULL_47_9]
MQLNECTITQARLGLDNKEFTSVELTQACLNVIKQKNKELNAVLTVCEEEALAEAKAADKRIKKGEAGTLTGIPYLAKDNYLTKGVRTTAASKILENYIAPYDATVIKRLREAGAVLLGKTNLDEFAHGSSTENSAFGVVKNPHDVSRVAGGSSGGSAAAVAANMCLFALGSDTGGSIRCPASFCGVVGLKPTYGRASRFGIVAMTSSTDVPGPLAKTAADAAFVQQIISGHDKNDFTTVERAVPDFSPDVASDVAGLKIGVPDEFFISEMDQAVAEKIKETIAALKARGAKIINVSLPHTKYALPVYYIITPSEVSSNLGRYDGIRYGFSAQKEAENLADIYFKTRGRGFGQEPKRRIMLGTYVLSAGYYDAYYVQAQKVRTIINREFDEVFKKVDVLVTPATPGTAFKIGVKKDPLSMYLEDIFTLSPSLAGLPAISVPCGLVDNLPVGCQIIGRKFAEGMVMKVASKI